MGEAPELYRRAAESPWIDVRGIACHIGSQLTDLAPIADSLQRVLALADRLEQDGIPLYHLDLGGGLGIRYRDESPPSKTRYVEVLCRAPTRYELHIEPGRSVVGDAGVLLSTVEYLKQTPARTFAICDAAMTELIRPALYEAWHAVELLEPANAAGWEASFDFVGPVCENADFLAHGRTIRLTAGTRVAFMQAGAYGSAMGSNYNSRPRPPEVLVDGARVSEIRRAERIADLMALERMAGTE
jgi:diaminopimelate decarboxylase